MRYDYLEAIKEDVYDYINDEIDLSEWTNRRDELEEFGQPDINIIEKGAEWCDVIIRCYLLSQTIAEVLDDLALD